MSVTLNEENTYPSHHVKFLLPFMYGVVLSQRRLIAILDQQRGLFEQQAVPMKEELEDLRSAFQKVRRCTREWWNVEYGI